MHTDEKQNELSDYAKKTIRHKARSLVGRKGFTMDDIDDIEQEMTLDLIERMPKFDPDKAAQSTFIARVIDHKISKILRHRTQEMRDFHRESCSLNDLIEDSDGGVVERIHTLDREGVDLCAGGHSRTCNEDAQLRFDVSLVISGLPKDLKALAEHLMTETFTEASKSLGVPRATLYGARDRLRRIFEDAGLKEYM